MIRISHLTPVLAAVALIASATLAGAPARAEERPRIMTVTGQGQVSAEPDIATIHLGVVTQAPTAQAALSANSTAMNKVFTAMDRRKIAKKDIQTSGFSIRPVYKAYPRGSSGPRVIEGYSVSNRVAVIVRDLDKLGGMIDAVVEDGANQFQGLTFGFAEPTPLLDEARKLAAADAQRKAKLYAEALGLRLGAIRTLHERTHGRARPAYEATALARDVATPIAAGESSLDVTITIEYELVGGN